MAKKSMILKQQAEPKFSSRRYNRCKICGRPHAYLRDYGVCRICYGISDVHFNILLLEVTGFTR